jgi:hypothetical protein
MDSTHDQAKTVYFHWRRFHISAMITISFTAYFLSKLPFTSVSTAFIDKVPVNVSDKIPFRNKTSTSNIRYYPCFSQWCGYRRPYMNKEKICGYIYRKRDSNGIAVFYKTFRNTNAPTYFTTTLLVWTNNLSPLRWFHRPKKTPVQSWGPSFCVCNKYCSGFSLILHQTYNQLVYFTQTIYCQAI